MIEVLIITVLVLWSCVVVFKKVLPNFANQISVRLANFCTRQGWQGLAKWFSPKMSTGCAGGCGCGSESDESTRQHAQEIKTVKWK